MQIFNRDFTFWGHCIFINLIVFYFIVRLIQSIVSGVALFASVIKINKCWKSNV